MPERPTGSSRPVLPDSKTHGGLGSFGISRQHRLMVRNGVEPVRTGLVLDTVSRTEGVHDHHVQAHHEFVVRGPQQIDVEVLV
jgi:hypothetical protein